jgi:hypothetical protein
MELGAKIKEPGGAYPRVGAVAAWFCSVAGNPPGHISPMSPIGPIRNRVPRIVARPGSPGSWILAPDSFPLTRWQNRAS